MADGGVRTTCPYCGTGCGLVVTPEADGWKVAGDPQHPANFGRLCSKGTALADTLAPDSRLLRPEVDGRAVDWTHATAEAAGRIRSVIELHGPDSFAFYLSGQLLTEDYYAANKLAKGFLGTANVDTNSRLCMASTVAGHRRAFGSDSVPQCYDDLELADLVVLAGSNLAWCHPVLFQRLKKAREDHGTRVVVIDPRRTDCCDIADLHLALAPGSDVALWNGLLAHCEAAGLIDFPFVDAHTEGFTEALSAARAADTCQTGLAPADIATFFQWFAATPKVVTIFSQGVNQSASGTDKVNAILNVHLATARIGKPGCGPFSVTGQPNAMGGREVGGLANQLAAHMGFDQASVDRVGRFWNAARMASSEGLKAVELFRAVDAGKVKAIWIMGTNPAVSLPEADLVRRALAKCPVVIVSDCVADTDTMRFAHIKLPAHGWGEKNGTVTNSDRTISRQRPFLSPVGEARSDWQAISAVAGHLGFGSAFAWKDSAAIFAEYARLTAFENGGSRDLDLTDWIGGDYDAMVPTQWGGKRMFADGRFFTADGKARLVAVTARPPREMPNVDWPLRLNTGRYRDQWHTMTRTGLSARLSGHRSEPLLDINPIDVGRLNLLDGALVRVKSRLGDYVARLRATTDQRPGDVFLPMHWTDRFAARAIVGRLLAGHVDPVSGQPESKHMPVKIEPFTADWSAVLVAAAPLDLPDLPWWVRHAADGAQITELAGDSPAQVQGLVAALDARFGRNRLEVMDPARGIARYAWMDGEHLAAALFVGRDRPDVVRAWVARLVGRAVASASERAAVLAGKAPAGQTDQGAIVCACFSVGLATIEAAIRDQHLTDVAQIGAALKAGTGCGSCIPELKGLLARKVAAE
ncbi:nitrate reductase [Magnetospirillum moscoviense]|uniref:Nitrate reductase n=1 Tax=Magnetospirillum moscoviense TaxID=1437059 RepID=A0A178MMP6_9PROT|nr:nitrate reductase [Magnetospirillum moscoviense]OAN50042.1 nitrate reductase [Magnetospirillum moscoviense]